MASETTDAPSKKKGFLVPLLALLVGGALAVGLTQVGPVAALLGASPTAAAVTDTTPPPPEYGAFAELPGIVVNPRGTGGRRYLMVKVGVEAEEPETLERLAELEPAAVDAVIDLLGAESVERLTDISRRDTLKTQILNRFNTMLGEDGPAARIYFTQYVLQ